MGRSPGRGGIHITVSLLRSPHFGASEVIDDMNRLWTLLVLLQIVLAERAALSLGGGGNVVLNELSTGSLESDCAAWVEMSLPLIPELRLEEISW